MKVLVTGSRSFQSKTIVWQALSMHNPKVAVHGGASGADKYASDWVKHRASLGFKVTEEIYHPNWKELGRRAGMVRNQVMVSNGADICLAFLRNDLPCNGTRDCMKRAKKEGIQVIEYIDSGSES